MPTSHADHSKLDLFMNAGRILLALPMLVYPYFHFAETVFVASIVPPWIPWHVFWTYFTACTLFGAGLAILAFKKYAYIPSVLLGIEIFLFCILIHRPLIFHRADDPWVKSLVTPAEGASGEFMNCFKDFGICGAAFIFAGSLSASWRKFGKDIYFTIGRTILATCLLAFAVLHFVYPAYAPGIEPMFTTIGFPLPGEIFWVYLSAAILFVTGFSMLVNRQTRLAATVAGIMLLAFDLLIWVPRFVQSPIQLAGNWLKDLGCIGGCFILAAAQPRESGAAREDLRDLAQQSASQPTRA